MIRFDLSRELAKPLARHLKPARSGEPLLLWRADVAMIGADVCVVAQEQQTQYLMVLCGLSSDQFSHFPALFRERFWRETAAICKQAGLYDSQTLARSLGALCDQQHYQLDPLPQEEGPISKTLEKLERRFLYEDLPLPIDGRSAFEFGFELNSKLSRAARESGQPCAAEALGNLCLNLIEAEMEISSAGAVTSVEDNVVTVDFARRGK